jgi:hypothetical protein
MHIKLKNFLKIVSAKELVFNEKWQAHISEKVIITLAFKKKVIITMTSEKVIITMTSDMNVDYIQFFMYI